MRDKPRTQILGACVAGVQGKNISMGEVEARGVQIVGGNWFGQVARIMPL